MVDDGCPMASYDAPPSKGANKSMRKNPHVVTEEEALH